MGEARRYKGGGGSAQPVRQLSVNHNHPQPISHTCVNVNTCCELSDHSVDYLVFTVLCK